MPPARASSAETSRPLWEMVSALMAQREQRIVSTVECLEGSRGGVRGAGASIESGGRGLSSCWRWKYFYLAVNCSFELRVWCFVFRDFFLLRLPLRVFNVITGRQQQYEECSVSTARVSLYLMLPNKICKDITLKRWKKGEYKSQSN